MRGWDPQRPQPQLALGGAGETRPTPRRFWLRWLPQFKQRRSLPGDGVTEPAPNRAQRHQGWLLQLQARRQQQPQPFSQGRLLGQGVEALFMPPAQRCQARADGDGNGGVVHLGQPVLGLLVAAGGPGLWVGECGELLMEQRHVLLPWQQQLTCPIVVAIRGGGFAENQLQAELAHEDDLHLWPVGQAGRGEGLVMAEGGDECAIYYPLADEGGPVGCVVEMGWHQLQAREASEQGLVQGVSGEAEQAGL